MDSYDVFLSYPTRLHAHVLDLAKRLEGDGVTVFLDRWNLVPGQPWPPAPRAGMFTDIPGVVRGCP